MGCDGGEIQRALQSEGYSVALACDGEQGLSMGLSGGLDLMVLDVMLPRRDGFDVIRNLRAAKQTLPTIMVTARDAMSDIVRGLDSGADDYPALCRPERVCFHDDGRERQGARGRHQQG